MNIRSRAAHDRRMAGIVVLLLAVVVLVSLAVLLGGPRWLHAGRPLTAAIELEVRADRGWQDSGIELTHQQRVQLQYVSGVVNDAEQQIAGGEGYDYICGASTCCEPMPNEPRGALLARVANDTWKVGNERQLVVPAGRLELRINDCDEGLYDNGGALLVRVAPSAP